MAPTNDFVPFCPTDTGTNLLTQGDYLADPQLAIGNQPGAARSKLVNKAIRQATYMASCLAQYLANVTGDNVLDDATQSEVLTTMNKAFKKTITVQKFLSGSGTYTTPAGVAYLRVRMVGGGQGGQSSGASPNAGAVGGNTTFGTTLLVAGGAGVRTGGTASLGTGPIGLALAGSDGGGGFSGPSSSTAVFGGAAGASSPFGGAGRGGDYSTAGGNAAANTGSGGGGGGTDSTFQTSGYGGAAGGFVDAIINSPASTYAYAVGAGGAGGAAGEFAGGNGGSGLIVVEEHY